MPTSPAAEEGTRAHDWGAGVLDGQHALEDVPGEYRAGVQIYTDYVQTNYENIIVERYWESWTIDGFAGTADCVAVEDDKVAVVDFKYGKWPVDAKQNSQLLCYAALVSEHFPASEFEAVIVQPNSWKDAKVSKDVFSIAQVEDHKRKVQAAATSDVKVTGEHCLWCPLLKLSKCAEGKRHAQCKGWTQKYKHLKNV